MDARRIDIFTRMYGDSKPYDRWDWIGIMLVVGGLTCVTTLLVTANWSFL